MHRLLAIALALVALGVMAGGYFYFTDNALRELWQDSSQGASANAQETGDNEPPLTVEVVQASYQIVPEEQFYSGLLVAFKQVAIRPRVTGYLVEREFVEGGQVEADEVLYQIDPRPFENALNQLLGERQSVQAQLDFLTSEVARLEALEDEAFASVSRLQELVSQRKQATATLQQLAARIDQVRLDLDFATINAPFSGRIGFSAAEVGDLVVANGDPLTTLVTLDPIWVQFRPADDQLAAIQRRLSAGATLPVYLTFGDGTSYEPQGELVLLDNQLDRQTGTVRARARLPNPRQQLLPGRFVRVRLVIEQREALLLPTETLVTQQGEQGVMVVDEEGRVARQGLTVGSTVGRFTEVIDGLSPEARVITTHLQQLRPGQSVQVKGDVVAASSSDQ